MHFERCSMSKSFDSCYCRKIGYWKNGSIELFGSLPILPVIVKQHLAFSDAGSGCCSYCLLLLYICALGLELVLTLLAPFNPCSIQGIEGYNALTSKNSIAFCWSFFLPIWFLKLFFFYDINSNDYFWCTGEKNHTVFLPNLGEKLFGQNSYFLRNDTPMYFKSITNTYIQNLF